jgi:hypothetical protein
MELLISFLIVASLAADFGFAGPINVKPAETSMISNNRESTTREEYEGSASNGYNGRQVIILEDKNGYGGYNSYGQEYPAELYGDHGYNNGGYNNGGYNNYYGPIIVHIPNSYPYYPEHVPLYGSYSYPAHTPHYESNYNSYQKS